MKSHLMMLYGLTRVVWFEVENIRLSCKSIHVVLLVVFILIAVDQVDNVVSTSGTKVAFSASG